MTRPQSHSNPPSRPMVGGWGGAGQLGAPFSAWVILSSSVSPGLWGPGCHSEGRCQAALFMVSWMPHMRALSERSWEEEPPPKAP